MAQREDTSRSRKRLDSPIVKSLTKRGMYPDGNGLYLQVTASGGKSWVFRYQRDGRAHWLGLGPLRLVGLAEARGKALKLQKDLLDSIDPAEARKARAGRTFGEVAALYIKEHTPGWRSPIHLRQWRSSLENHVLPKIGSKPVAEVNVEDVLACIRPIWSNMPTTADRVRNRIELVIAYSMARGWRLTGPNPAAWRGHMEKLLPAKGKVAGVKHLTSLPYQLIPALMQRLAEIDSPSARALQVTILTGTRTSEALGMMWCELDLDAGLWVIPPSRTKNGKEHRVPLAPATVAILRQQREITGDQELIFAGERRGRSLSVDTMHRLLRWLKVPGTVHGMRSSFRQWIAECTDAPHEIAEMALGHVVGDAVVRAYQRSDLIARRRKLAQDWAAFALTGHWSCN